MELLKRLHAHAKARLSPEVYSYFASGAGCESLLEENEAAWQRVAITPSVCTGSYVFDACDAGLEQYGLLHPLAFAPAAAQKLLHPDGEFAVARAAAKRKTIFCLSTRSTADVGAIAEVAEGCLWFQLYVGEDRNHVRRVLRRLRSCGVKAVLLTVDMPAAGRRDRQDYYGPLRLPDGVAITNHLGGYFQTEIKETGGWDASLSWHDFAWIKENAELPLFVKGILTAEDAIQAVEYGADGIVVSNHGARQLDGVAPTAAVLPAVSQAVKGRAVVLVDGGVRSGEDILRAQSLGAQAVMVGRPYLWGLAAAGEEGVLKTVDSLIEDWQRASILVGAL